MTTNTLTTKTRGRKPGEMKTRPLTARIPVEIAAKLGAMATADDRSLSYVIGRPIEAGLAARSKA